MASVAPSSEAIYAEITRRYGARRLAELQEMLGHLEQSLAELGVSRRGNSRGVKADMRVREASAVDIRAFFRSKCPQAEPVQNRRRGG